MPIFDQGYQHWNGSVGGHTWRWLAITRHGIRTQMTGWLIRLVLILAWLPAIILAVALSLWGLVEQQSDLVTPILNFIELPEQISADPVEYRAAVWTLAYHHFFQFEIFFSMIMVLLIGPGLISKDLRFNAMPLYLSRPMTRLDYFIGKLGVIVFAVGLVSVVPAAIAYLLGILFSLDPTVLGDTFPLFLGAVAFGLVVALSAGMLMLGLSSLSRNSRYVALFWIGVWFVSSTVAGVLSGINMTMKLQEIQRERMAEFEGRPPVPPSPPKADGSDRRERERERRKAVARAEEQQRKFQQVIAETVRDDWRPMVSFTGNLYRIEAALLNTNPAWEKIGSIARNPFEPAPEAEPAWVTQQKGPQYPWYWSAGVLLGLMGISAFILHKRVRSLDRLR